MRPAAIVLAAFTAIAQLALFVLGEAQLDVAALEAAAGGSVGPWWGRASWSVGWAAPWAVGAAILAWGRPRIGTAVIVTVAALSLVQGLAVVSFGASVAEDPGLAVRSLGAVGSAIVWGTGVAAGVTAWLARPGGGWREGAPGPGGWFTAAAIAAWLPTAFHSTAFAPPGTPRRFIEPFATGLDVTSLPLLVQPVVVAIVLLIAPRLQAVLAGAVTLTFAVPQLVSHTETLRVVIAREQTIPTPVGVLGALGLVGLVVAGCVWVLRGRGQLSGATTGRGPGPEA